MPFANLVFRLAMCVVYFFLLSHHFKYSFLCVFRSSSLDSYVGLNFSLSSISSCRVTESPQLLQT